MNRAARAASPRCSAIIEHFAGARLWLALGLDAAWLRRRGLRPAADRSARRHRHGRGAGVPAAISRRWATISPGPALPRRARAVRGAMARALGAPLRPGYAAGAAAGRTTKHRSAFAPPRRLPSAAGRLQAVSARPACSRCSSTTFRARAGDDLSCSNSRSRGVMLPCSSPWPRSCRRRLPRSRWPSARGRLPASIGWTRRGVQERNGASSRAPRKAPAPAFGCTPASRPRWRKERCAHSSTNIGPASTRSSRRSSGSRAITRAAQQLGCLGSAVAAALLLFVGVRLLSLPFPVLIASLVLFARMSGPAQSLQQAVQNIAAYAPCIRGDRAAPGARGRNGARASSVARRSTGTSSRPREAGFEHAPGLGCECDAAI